MRNVKIVILGLVVALGFSGCSLFMGGEQKQSEVKNYCPLPNGVLERYEKMAKFLKADIKQDGDSYIGDYECKGCGNIKNENIIFYEYIVAKIISPNNKIDLSTTAPLRFKIKEYNGNGDYIDNYKTTYNRGITTIHTTAYSFNEVYNDKDYRKSITCDERLAAYNQALDWYQKNQAFGRSLDYFVDRKIKHDDIVPALDAELAVLKKFTTILDKKTKKK